MQLIRSQLGSDNNFTCAPRGHLTLANARGRETLVI